VAFSIVVLLEIILLLAKIVENDRFSYILICIENVKLICILLRAKRNLKLLSRTLSEHFYN